jgi:hypothetical protein
MSEEILMQLPVTIEFLEHLLTTDSHNPSEAGNKIYLEPEVVDRLILALIEAGYNIKVT